MCALIESARRDENNFGFSNSSVDYCHELFISQKDKGEKTNAVG